MIENRIKTALLLAALSALLLVIGWLLGSYAGLSMALCIAVIMNFISYWFSDKIALLMYRAKPLRKDECPWVHLLVEEVAEEAQIPKPAVYVIETNNCNAFATGRSPKKAAIALTRGIISLLNREELKGVIAHEISHIKNRDTLIQTIAAIIATVIAYIAFIARFAAIFGGVRTRDSRGLELLFLAILAPIIATIIRLAISRSREYLADELGARLTKSPKHLASALLKLYAANKINPLRFGSSTTEGMFIVNPFRGNGFFTLFMTHPPIKKRVQRLEQMKV